MRTIIIAAVIAILAGIVYQKIVEENVSMKEIAGYITDTTSFIVDETSKAIDINNNVKGIEENKNHLTKSTPSILQEKRNELIQEQLTEIVSFDINNILKTVTCDKALLEYNNYISGGTAINNDEENIYKIFTIMQQKGYSDKVVKDMIISFFCNNN